MVDQSGLDDFPGLDGAVLGAALQSAGVAVVITSLDLEAPGPIIQYVNPVMEVLTGYSEAELLGRSPRILQGPRTDRAALDELKGALTRERHFAADVINYRKGGEEYFVDWTISALRDSSGAARHWMAVQRDVTTSRTERRGQFAEAHAETRNLLAELRALVSRTVPETTERERLVERIEALARVQGLLSDQDGARKDFVDLRQLFESEFLAQALESDRISISGPPVELPGSTVKILASAVHELTINAIRHGALTQPPGAVGVSWSISDREHDRLLTIRWNESGFALPGGVEILKGYGREVLEGALPFALRARTTLETEADGFDWVIAIPLGSGRETEARQSRWRPAGQTAQTLAGPSS